MKGFQKGDPRAVLAGRKGGKVMRATRTPEYLRGFKAGWAAKKRDNSKGNRHV